MLIDADNSPAGKIDFIIGELATIGVVDIRRAYGNWKSTSLAGWEKILNEFAIQPIQQFDLVKGKNATDIALVIDAMDILFTKNVDAFCIVSSDADFTPLVQRLRADGKEVIGFGGQKSSEPFVKSCSRFLVLDDDKSSKENRTDRAADPIKLKSDTKLMNTLRVAIDAVGRENEDGWSMLGPVGTHISNHSPIDPRNYGLKKLSDLFRAIDLFEVRQTKSGTQTVVWVRNKKRPKSADASSSKANPDVENIPF